MKALSDLAVLHYVIDASEEIASCIAEREGCKWSTKLADALADERVHAIIIPLRTLTTIGTAVWIGECPMPPLAQTVRVLLPHLVARGLGASGGELLRGRQLLFPRLFLRPLRVRDLTRDCVELLI